MVKEKRKIKSNNIKIFLASTFTDFRLERDYLLINIVPKINEYCKKKYGKDFQLIDRRWGVSDDDTDNRLFSIIDEVDTCNDESMGPTFVALIGNRYGYRTLPVKLEATKFEVIKIEIYKTIETDSPENLSLKYCYEVDGIEFKSSNLFETCYKMNKNENPHHYWLLPSKQIFIDLVKNNPKNQHLTETLILNNWIKYREMWNKVWKQIKMRLLNSFRNAAEFCLQKSMISREYRDRFYISITEGEIINGVFERNNGTPAKDNCLIFIRKMNDIDVIKSKIDNCLKIIKNICKCDPNGSNQDLMNECKKLTQIVQLSSALVDQIQKLMDNTFVNDLTDEEKNNPDEIKFRNYRNALIDKLKDEFKPCFSLFDADRIVDHLKCSVNNEDVIFEDGDTRDEVMLDKLKNKINHFIKENTIFYEIECDQINGLDVEINKNKMLETFGDMFYNKLIELIDRNQQTLNSDGLFDSYNVQIREELLNQYNKEILTKLFDYINDDETSDSLVVIGNSGSGKTSLMAKFVEKVNDIGDPKVITILRFLGTTPLTTNITNTFKTIISELDTKLSLNIPFSDEIENVTSKNKARNILSRQLDSVPKDKKVIIILDAIDQLNKNDLDLNWLISSHPKNVKFIYSCRNLDTLSNLTSVIINVRMIEIKGLSVEIAESYVSKLLELYGRNLNESQMEIIQTNINQAAERNELYPLYVKLLFEIASEWYSFEEDLIDVVRVETKTSWNSIFECIEHLFKKLECQYGRTLFQRCLAYINLSETGISDVELEDVLSVDDQVLESLFLYQEPPQRHFPPEMWSRIKFFFKDYLSVKTINNITVFYWYHNEFSQVVDKLYLRNLDYKQLDEYLKNMIDVYTEKWKNESKEFKRSEFIVKESLGKLQERDKAKRFTSPQPYIFKTDKAEIKNERKLRKMIEYITKITYQPLQAEFMVKHVLLNFDFIMTNGITGLTNFDILSKTVRPIANEYNDPKVFAMLKKLNDTKFSILNEFVLYIYQTNTYELSHYRDSSFLQLCSYLLCFYGISNEITKFIDECDEKATNSCALVAPYKNQIVTPNKMILGEYTNKTVTCATLFFSNNSSYIVFCGENLYIFTLYKGKDLEIEYQQFDEIELPHKRGVRETWNKMCAYVLANFENAATENKKLFGGCVISSKHTLCSIDFNGKTFIYHDFNNEVIADCEVLDTDFYLIRLENAKECSIINIKSTILTNVFQKLEFTHKIKCIGFSSAWSVSSEVPYLDFDRTYHLAICLDNNEIFIYLRNPINSNKFLHRSKLTFDSPVSQCLFNVDIQPDHDNIETYNSKKLLTIHDNNFCRLIYDDKIVTIERIDKFNSSDKLKIVNFENSLAVIKSNKKLYVFNAKQNNGNSFKKMVIIDGDYNGIRTLFTKQNIIIGAYGRRTIDYYYINQFDDDHSSYNIGHLIHTYKPNDIIFVSKLTNSPISLQLIAITASTQVYFENLPLLLLLQNSPFNHEFDRSEYKIDKIVNFGNSSVCSYSYDTNHIDIWSLSTGKLQPDLKLKIDDKKIKDFVICKDIFIVLSIEESNENGEYLFADMYLRQDNSLQHTFFLGNNTNYHLLIKYDQNNMSVICHLDHFVNTINFNTVDQYFEQSINLFEIFKEKYTFLSAYCITYLSGYLVTIIDNTVHYVDYERKTIIFSQSTFLQSEECKGLTCQIIPIIDLDDVIIIIKGFGLVYIKLNKNDDQTISFKIFKKELSDFECEMWEIKRDVLCLLDEDKNTFYLVDLFSIQSQIEITEIHLDSKSSKHFSLSDNLCYLAVCDIDALSLYKLEDNFKKVTKVAIIPMFDEVTSVTINNSFVNVSIFDKRVISFLICDNEEQRKRVKSLASRDQSRQLLMSDLDYLIMPRAISNFMTDFLDVDLSEKGVINKVFDNVSPLENTQSQRVIDSFNLVSNILNMVSENSFFDQLPGDFDNLISKTKDVCDAVVSFNIIEMGLKLVKYSQSLKSDIKKNIREKIKTKELLSVDVSEKKQEKTFYAERKRESIIINAKKVVVLYDDSNLD